MHTSKISAKPTAFEELRYGHFDFVFDNIIKTIRGGVNPVGTTTLAMCAISSLSEIEWSLNHQKQLKSTGELSITTKDYGSFGYVDKEKFEGWLNRWVRDSGINSNCDSPRVYGLRCALIHTGGDSEALYKTGVKGWSITVGQLADHYSVKPGIIPEFQLEMPDFLSEIILAADLFLNDSKTILENASPEFLLRIGFLCLPLSFDCTTRLVNNAGSLSWFDPRLSLTPLQITKTELASKIREAYLKEVKDERVFQY